MCSIAIFQTAPATSAGVIGAMFNCAIQLGAALGLSIDTSIETSVEARHGGFEAFTGRRAVLWWLLAVVAAEWAAVTVFYRVPVPDEGQRDEKASREDIGQGDETTTVV